MIQILGLLGMCFDVVVAEVKTFLLLFKLALAIPAVGQENKNQMFTTSCMVIQARF